MSKILLCEPQEDLANAMREFFAVGNYTIDLETSGLRVLEYLRQKKCDVIILEMALHGLDGLSVIRSYRAAGGGTPILLLTGVGSSSELQRVFDAGADAYMAKPFRLADLAANIRALLRRPALREGRVLSLGSVVMDSVSGIVTRRGQSIHLFPMEFKLLEFLMKHPNQVFDARALLERVWQRDNGVDTDTVRTHIRTLRGKIDAKECPSLITTVRGFGYKTEFRGEPALCCA
jgi:two-component system, OmpR family, response regulator